MFEEQILIEQNKVKNQIDKDIACNFQDLIILLSSSTFYSNYIAAEIDYTNYLLIKKLSYEMYFSEDSLSSSMCRNSISELLLNFSNLDYTKVCKLIDEGVELYINFNIRPITTIFTFIFNGNDTISKEEFLLRLAYFPNSNPLAEFLHDIVHNFNSDIINKIKLLSDFYSYIDQKISNSEDSIILDIASSTNEMLNSINSQNLLLLVMIILFDNLHLYSLSENLNSYLDAFDEFDLDKLKEILENNSELTDNYPSNVEPIDENLSDELIINEEELDSLEDEFDDFEDEEEKQQN